MKKTGSVTIPGIMALSEAEIEATLAQGDFPASVRNSATRTIVIMSQDWCPQWHDMASWIGEFADKARIYAILYNQRLDFDKIMTFKEDVFGNREVPYIRAYLDGKLLYQGNWMPRNTFAALLTREHRS